jgi:Sel1 repeat
MTVEYEAIAVGAFLFVATLIWITDRSRKRLRALETRLEIIQKEVNVLLMQESQRLMMEMNAHSKVEAPKIVSNDAPQLREKLPRVALLPFVGGLPPVDAPHTPPNHASAEPKMPAPLLRRSSIAFSGTKTFLIGGAVAAALAYIFVFESSPPEIDEAFAPVTASIDMQPVTPAPPPQSPPPTIEAQGIPARTGAEREIRAPSLQPTPDLGSRPSESKADITALRPTPDLEGRPNESKADITALQPTPDLEGRTNESKADITAPQPTPDLEGRPNESKAGITAPQPTPDLESRPNESRADIAAPQPTPDLESRPNESRTADDKSSAVPDMRPVSEHLSEQDINGDYATALRLLHPLAERGNRQAQYNLAVMYANGWGVPRDEAESNRWYHKAAEQGDASAQSLVGSAYLFGRGAPKDFVQAYLWLNLAARGDKSAAQVRDDLEGIMTAAQISEARRLTREWEPK